MKATEQLQVYSLTKSAGLSDYRPFNLGDSIPGAAWGAGAGALTGMGIQGIRKALGYGDPQQTLLGMLLKGGLYGAGVGATLPLLSGLLGPKISGQIGKHKALNASGIDKLEGKIPTEHYRTARDTIAAGGKHYTEAASKQLSVGDIARQLLNRDPQP